MKVRTLFLIVISSLSICAFAGKVSLPLGGQLPLDTKLWSSDSLKGVPGGSGLIFINKNKKELQGLVLDGTIKDKGACEGEAVPKKWKTCLKVVPVGKSLSYQLYSQRKIEDKVFQNYVITFDVPTSKKIEFEKEILALKKYIEVHP